MTTISIVGKTDRYTDMLIWMFENKVSHQMGGDKYEKWGHFPDWVTMADSDAIVFKLKFGL